MLSRSALHRPAAVMAAVALAAGVAGCGGSDGGDDAKSSGGSADTAYASSWNDVCTSLTTAQTTLQADSAKAQKQVDSGDVAALAKATAKPVGAYVESLVAGLERVQDLDAPKAFASFQAGVKKSAPVTVKFFQELKDPIASGDLDAITKAFKRFNGKSLFPAVPADLKKQASACGSF
ncbi:hypothetical protein AB0L40_21030 [Patulibacter sp. NPDC049589]|uniref:hypothetical protein n=1 Tax=Patulibacter sp. NPDC049589 TaxID=3154731 RepID=UPI0034170DC7